MRKTTFKSVVAAAKSTLSNTVRFGGILSAVVLFVVTLLIVADIAARRLFARPLPGVLEFSEILLVFVVFSAVALAQAGKRHIRFDRFLEQMSRRKALAIQLVVLLLCLFYTSFMAIVTSKLAYLAVLQGEYRFGLINIPTWPARIVIGLGTILLSLQIFYEITQNLRQLIACNSGEHTTSQNLSQRATTGDDGPT